MKIKIVYETRSGPINVTKEYKDTVTGCYRNSVLLHVSVSGPYPVQTMLSFKSWVSATENLTNNEEKQALLPEEIKFATETWSEIL